MPLRLAPGDKRVLRHVHEAGEAAVEQGHLDAGTLSPVQRGEHPGGGVKAGEHVDQRDSHLVRGPLLRSRDRHQARLGLRHEVVAGTSGRLALGAESGDRAVHDRRVLLADLLVADAEPVRTSDLEVLDHHVGGRAELESERAALRLGEVERAAALAAVDRQVVGRLPAREGRPPGARLVAALGALDLDHVRAEVGEHHRAVGPGEHAREVGHPHAGERSGAGRTGGTAR